MALAPKRKQFLGIHILDIRFWEVVAFLSCIIFHYLQLSVAMIKQCLQFFQMFTHCNEHLHTINKSYRQEAKHLSQVAKCIKHQFVDECGLIFVKM